MDQRARVGEAIVGQSVVGYVLEVTGDASYAGSGQLSVTAYAARTAVITVSSFVAINVNAEKLEPQHAIITATSAVVALPAAVRGAVADLLSITQETVYPTRRTAASALLPVSGMFDPGLAVRVRLFNAQADATSIADGVAYALKFGWSNAVVFAAIVAKGHQYVLSLPGSVVLRPTQTYAEIVSPTRTSVGVVNPTRTSAVLLLSSTTSVQVS